MTSTNPASHIPITQASLVALLTTIAGNAVALVPAWAPQKTLIIQAGTFAIAVGFLIANAIHAHASGPAPTVFGEPLVAQLGEIAAPITPAPLPVDQIREEARNEVNRLFKQALSAPNVEQAAAQQPGAPPTP